MMRIRLHSLYPWGHYVVCVWVNVKCMDFGYCNDYDTKEQRFYGRGCKTIWSMVIFARILTEHFIGIGRRSKGSRKNTRFCRKYAIRTGFNTRFILIIYDLEIIHKLKC